MGNWKFITSKDRKKRSWYWKSKLRLLIHFEWFSPLAFSAFSVTLHLFQLNKLENMSPTRLSSSKRRHFGKSPPQQCCFVSLKWKFVATAEGKGRNCLRCRGFKCPPFRHGVFICGPSSAALHFEYIFRIFLGGACNFVSGFAFVWCDC